MQAQKRPHNNSMELSLGKLPGFMFGSSPRFPGYSMSSDGLNFEILCTKKLVGERSPPYLNPLPGERTFTWRSFLAEERCPHYPAAG